MLIAEIMDFVCKKRDYGQWVAKNAMKKLEKD